MSIIEIAMEGRSLQFPTDDDAFWEGVTGGASSKSGVAINEKTALGYSPVWRAQNLLSGDVAKLPLIVYKRVGAGKERDTNHPAYKLLKNQPNEFQTYFDFKKFVQGQASIHGNGYAFIERRGDGAPTALLPLSPINVTPVRMNKILWYIVNVDGEDRKVRPQNMIHIRGVGDTLQGYSTIKIGRESLGLGIAARDYGSRFFKNDAHPSFVLEHPNNLTDKAAEHLTKQWNKIHEGFDNAHKLKVLEEGMKLTTLNMNHDDAQFLQTREFQIIDVANWFGVPSHKIGGKDKTSFSSLEQENQSYLDEGLDPWLVAWEAECWSKLLTKPQRDRDTHVIEFTRGALVRANLQARGLYYKTAIMNGWLNNDEIRSFENMNPLPDGAGQRYWMPLNLQPITPKPGGEEEEPEAPIVEAHRNILMDAITRMIKRLNVHGERAHKKGQLGAWLDSGIEAHTKVIAEALAPAMEAARTLSLTKAGADDVIDTLTGLVRQQWGLVYNGTAQRINEDVMNALPDKIVETIITKGR